MIALRFAAAANRINAVARAAALTCPAFRTPPADHRAMRSVRRYPTGAVVLVRLRDRDGRDRPWEAIAQDMVEGVLVVNHVTGHDRLRAALLAAALDTPTWEDRGADAG